MDAPEELIKYISTNLKYLLHWENGMRLANASSISDHMNLLELSFYQAGLSENINEQQILFKELLDNAPAPNLIKYVIGTGRNRYEHKIPHDWQRPLVHEHRNNKAVRAGIWQPLLATNPYSEDTLIDRLRMTGSAAYEHRDQVRELNTAYIPGPGQELALPLKRNFDTYREYYDKDDYPAAVTSVAQSISDKLSTYPAPVLTDAQMRNKIITHKRESQHQLQISEKQHEQKHPGISRFYTPQPEETQEQETQTPNNQYTLDL